MEGYPFIIFTAFSTVVAAILRYDDLTLAAFLLTTFTLYFFRDPQRISPEGEDVLVAPADGKIILIEKVFDDRFVNEQVVKVSIFMNLFNVHVNRIPFPGKVLKVLYSPGRFFSANSEQIALENEYCAVILTTKKDQRMAVVQVAGLIARRIVCLAVRNDEFLRGERFGMIRFGSRVDLYLPLTVRLDVKKGQTVKGGETVLGYLSLNPEPLNQSGGREHNEGLISP